MGLSLSCCTERRGKQDWVEMYYMARVCMVNVASLLHESVVVAVVGWHSVRGAHCFSDLNIAGNMSIVLTHEGNCLSFTI